MAGASSASLRHVSGPRAGVMAAVGYLTLGLFSLPVFHGGGGLSYVLEPGFG